MLRTFYQFIRTLISIFPLFSTEGYTDEKHSRDKVLVFAASSMATALNKIVQTYQDETGHVILLSYASSSALARQLAYGAPADIFISAHEKWMDYAVKQGVINVSTLTPWVENSLVVVADNRQSLPFRLTPDNMLKVIGQRRLAIGDPRHVPSGIYTKEALVSLNLWNALKNKLAFSNSVRATLALVERGEAPLGIVYRSDALASSFVEVVAVIPDGTHTPIIFHKAITCNASESTVAFFEYLTSTYANSVLTGNGFILIGIKNQTFLQHESSQKSLCLE
ncbi:molybdate ABC transporter substrate-binding protein [Candidatus Enterovibrio escicola]|uniref:Molybdenum ABC transporter, periplasmic molybdenum-binding protein ModA n=1 Tax=Candidatus Enterovibrio escicola TaxID=1927127 RepID=A0A2A5T109_9GAMM|nr:molybdate ABC transporter substrate-binding protein [Candidatus Enterovibrio escacola]PCS21810.1 Molybdenum ABC transporter, periplasmic molybdenum-binding protein ModA [Candidatus Enterovibrio escacola]